MGDRSVSPTAVNQGRALSLAGRLAGAGSQNSAIHSPIVAGWNLTGDDTERLISVISSAADPDWALDALAELSVDDREALFYSPDSLFRFGTLTGASQALGIHLVRHPAQIRGLTAVTAEPQTSVEYRQVLLAAVGADPNAVAPTATDSSDATLNALRVAYRGALACIAVRDLVHAVVVDQTAAELADLADAALEAGLAIARCDVSPDATPCRFAVIAMGKCGGRELNYISDVDVVFVAEPVAIESSSQEETDALRTATQLAVGLIRACGAQTSEGSLWDVDAALRPEGKAGALVRTLASHRGYYLRWASTWEFQALLKARFSAGDRALGDEYVDTMSEFVWAAADRDGFVADVQGMRRRVEDNIPAHEADREIKLGRGGLRDVEFSVQLLQLVHGRTDMMLRSPTTLSALEALAVWGYVGREDGAVLAEAYRFLRTLEHRIQLQHLRRTHVMPAEKTDLRRLGRSMGLRQDPIEQLTRAWKQHTREVRRIHEKLFYRPLLQAVARLDAPDARLSVTAAEQRLSALGYIDSQGALRHLEALTSGVSRRAAIQRTLLPVLLDWFARGPDPDAALLGFRRLSEDLGSTPWYLRLLRDESVAAERMSELLSSSRYATDLLLRSPDALPMLAEDSGLLPRRREQLMTEMLASTARQISASDAVAFIRAVRRRELFRLSAGNILGLTSTVSAMQGLTAVTEAALAAALDASMRAVASESGEPFPTRLAIIALGRFGGAELGFGSDADVLFVHDPLPGVVESAATAAALAAINEMRRLLSLPSPDPELIIDADLRPEGRQGPLVRTLASYAAYYARWSAPWEAQALLRARAVAGDEALGLAFTHLIDPLRWPAAGIGDDALMQMRRLKARMESERLPRGADPTLHTKLGRGGLSDVEWVAQLIQLRYAAHHASLRTTSTLQVLQASVAADLMDASDADVLTDAWLLATRVRNAIVLASGKVSDVVPAGPPDLVGVRHLLGYRPGQGGVFLEDYRRITRRARQVMERLFYEQ